MTTRISVYVCDTAEKAATAKQFLISGGYPAAAVTVEQVGTVSYDAATYDGGAVDAQANKFVVIGRK